MSDLPYVEDSAGVPHGYMVIGDEDTDWMVSRYIGHGEHVKTAGQLCDYLEEGWINWAGPPDTFVADSERGFNAGVCR